MDIDPGILLLILGNEFSDESKESRNNQMKNTEVGKIMSNNLQSVNNAFKQRSGFILIALTGRTGAGCSTTASILHTDAFLKLDLSIPKTKEFKDVEERKYAIAHKFMSNGHWAPFTIIEGSSVIFSFVIELGLEELKRFLQTFRETSDNNRVRISSFTNLEERINGMSHFFEDSNCCKLINDDIDKLDDDSINKIYKFYIEDLPILKHEFQNILNNYICVEESIDRFSRATDRRANLYTFFMQKIGNNIRSSGNPYSGEYSEENYYQVANRINSIIKVIRKRNMACGNLDTRICIDAIRNPYEAFYFKDYYSSFYLISVNTEEHERKRRLANLDSEELASLDETEYPTKLKKDELFFHQNIPGCLEISDIHLYNPKQTTDKRFFLTEQLLKYLCLMIHPGLITPTNIERCMQLAYNAKLNSGCLSRQVGAVICDQHYSVKAVGWNDVPSGQIPCNLRDVGLYCVNMERASHSAFEVEDSVFSESIHALNNRLKIVALEDRFFPYCFKDIYEGITGAKNQVHTRSLHAEENAFLQISKYGGQGIEGGILFTTASPCELCSKKAYQLGIRDIYYIDPYPGISFSHVLTFGNRNNPALHLFYGAIGSAYVSLYTQRLSIKDELELMTGLNAKQANNYAHSFEYHQLGIDDIQYISRKTTFVFESRDKMKKIESVKIKALHDNISRITDAVYWTGSGFDGMSMSKFVSEDPNRQWDYKQIPNETDPYTGILSIEPPIMKDEIVSIEKTANVRDPLHIMFPYFAQMILVKTDYAEIEVRAKENQLKDVKAVVYADTEMRSEWRVSEETIAPQIVDDDGKTYAVFSYKIEKPNLRYSYCIEWNFC